MKCPVDGTTLQMTERQGVEIDYCPKCRGVWLNRGELDKIIERSTPAVELKEPGGDHLRRDLREMREDPRRDDEDRDDRYRHGKRYRKRKSFLSEIFDFD